MDKANRTVVRVMFDKSTPRDKHVPVIWTLDNSPDAFSDYYADAARLDAAGKSVRAELQKLADAGRANLSEKRKHELLKQIAIAGAELFEALFTGIDQEEAEAANVARTWYDENVLKASAPAIDIEFCTDPKMQPVRPLCPWGLVYPSPLLEGIDTVKSDVIHDRFWALQHRVTSYEGLAARRTRPNPAVAWQKVTFYAFMRGMEDMDVSVRDRLGKIMTEDTLLQSKRRLKDTTGNQPGYDTLYYVSRRDQDGDASTLSDRLRPDELAQLGNDDRSRVLAVLDGLSVMADAQASSWYKSVHDFNWAAFVAAEVDLEHRSLDYFGLKLIEQLVQAGDDEGAPLSEIFDLVRRSDQIRPWGLLFGLYAQPSRISVLKRPPPEHFLTQVTKAIAVLENWKQGRAS